MKQLINDGLNAVIQFIINSNNDEHLPLNFIILRVSTNGSVGLLINKYFQ